jgi:hypothetical protein
LDGWAEFVECFNAALCYHYMVSTSHEPLATSGASDECECEWRSEGHAAIPATAEWLEEKELRDCNSLNLHSA